MDEEKEDSGINKISYSIELRSRDFQGSLVTVEKRDVSWGSLTYGLIKFARDIEFYLGNKILSHIRSCKVFICLNSSQMEADIPKRFFKVMAKHNLPLTLDLNS